MRLWRTDASTWQECGHDIVGGGGAWDDNARLKGMGEKRVLKRLPETPTVRWTAWKKMPDVFL